MSEMSQARGGRQFRGGADERDESGRGRKIVKGQQMSGMSQARGERQLRGGGDERG